MNISNLESALTPREKEVIQNLERDKDLTPLARQHFFPYLYGQVALLEALRMLEFVPSGGYLLNGACGTGWFSFMAQQRGYRVESIDLSDKVLSEIDYLNRKLGTGITVKKASVTDLPYQDEVFNVVILSEILEHLPEPRKALNEAYRVLKDGGRLIVTVPGYLYQLVFDYFISKVFPNSYDKRLTEDYQKLQMSHQTEDLDYHINQFRIGEFKQFIHKSGFKLLHFENTMFLYPFISGFISGVLGKRGKLLDSLGRLDVNLARSLPAQLGSNWLVISEKIGLEL